MIGLIGIKKDTPLDIREKLIVKYNEQQICIYKFHDFMKEVVILIWYLCQGQLHQRRAGQKKSAKHIKDDFCIGQESSFLIPIYICNFLTLSAVLILRKRKQNKFKQKI